MKIGIIRCYQTRDYCPGVLDFIAIRERCGVFADVPADEPLVIVGFMGFTVGAVTEKHHGYGWNTLAIAAACVIKVVGYYIAESFIYGNWVAPVTSIPGNLVQIGVAAIIVIPIAERLRITIQRRL